MKSWRLKIWGKLQHNTLKSWLMQHYVNLACCVQMYMKAEIWINMTKMKNEGGASHPGPQALQCSLTVFPACTACKWEAHKWSKRVVRWHERRTWLAEAYIYIIKWKPSANQPKAELTPFPYVTTRQAELPGGKVLVYWLSLLPDIDFHLAQPLEVLTVSHAFAHPQDTEIVPSATTHLAKGYYSPYTNKLYTPWIFSVIRF